MSQFVYPFAELVKTEAGRGWVSLIVMDPDTKQKHWLTLVFDPHTGTAEDVHELLGYGRS